MSREGGERDTAVFNERFRQLSEGEQSALVLVAVSIAIVMTPAAYRRLAEQETVTPFFVRLASRFIAAMIPLMVALSLEVYLLGRRVLNGAAMAAWIAGTVFALFAALWFVFPMAMRHRGRR